MNKFFIAFTFLLVFANFPLLAMESKSNTSEKKKDLINNIPPYANF